MSAMRTGLTMLILTLLLGATSACSHKVYTKINAFRADNTEFGRGPILVRAATQETGESLEFAYYKGRIEAALANLGYEPVSDAAAAQFQAVVSYGVEESEAEDRGLRTGFVTPGYTHSYGARVGVMVIDDNRDIEFVRRLSLTISRIDPAQRLYEVTGFSRGRCGVFSVVFDEMLEAIFKDFPAESGSVRTIGVRGESRC